MTSRAAETQQLIADIDRLLSNKRLPRLFSSQASEPRQLLERIRDFLVNLSENQAQTLQEQQPQQSPLLAKFLGQDDHQSSPQPNQLQQEEKTHVVVEQENHPLATVLAPLQEEIKTLLQERSNLVEEIRQLEQKRLHNHSLAQQLANQEQMISEFLQVLTSRIMPDLTPQTTETTANSQMRYLPMSYQDHTEPATSKALPVLESPEQVERLSRLANELDQKLLALDGTVNVVFDALQGNIHTYHESLSQALARMHSKGVQGEQLLATLISNLTEQLQQQTSIKDERPQLGESGQLASELPQLTQNNQPVSLEGHASDSNAVLSQHRQDSQNSVETPDTSRLQQYSSPFIRDEVDQLYASLFGVEVTDVAKDKVTDFTDEFFEEPTATTSARSEVTDVTKLSALDTTEVTTFIDEFFGEQTTTTPEVTTDHDTDVTDVTTNEVTNVIDELFDEPTVVSSTDTSPATVTDQPQSEFLYEITFEAPQVSTEQVTDVTTSSSVSNFSETSPDAATNQEQQVDSVAGIPDPWLEETKADLVEPSRQDAEGTQDVVLETTEQSSIPQENILAELPVEGHTQVVS
ncbi:MAG: hypothetical protein HC773_23260, partial [Scytonema sp. CRU_2_7]|nr:hypothetical protein [Scytonema sp. CRU_2_7]